ncbi:MAG: biotin synthase BioB [Gammaproteobacteria bacterium]|nr:MAG: biotin synthase BioB [Gammaproteobacteria bacterium]
MISEEKLFSGQPRNDWTREEVYAIAAHPLMELVYQAQRIHRMHFRPNRVQTSTLLSIKTGACPEDCKYCPQSARYDTGLTREQLMAVEEVVERARAAKARGATRFCMGAAWRRPRDKDFRVVLEMVRQVKALGLETCVTLGMLTQDQAQALKEAGLDYYNHNIDTSERYYREIITTRTFADRLQTLAYVRDAGIQVCAGGIIGMGESEEDRWQMLWTLATLPAHPDSVPINQLVAVKGTPLENAEPVSPFEFVRTIAVARILMPRAYVRLSAGRESMSDELQALCFMAGANSIFYGEQLLTTPNPQTEKDQRLLAELGIEIEAEAGDSLMTEAPVWRDETALYHDAAH